MRKLVLLHKRRPGSDVAAFHAALAGLAAGDPALPGLVRYVQSHTLVQGYAKGELPFDAVEELAFGDAGAAAEAAGSAEYRALCQRREGLVDAAASLSMTVDVHVIKDGAIPDNAVKNIEFVSRRPDLAVPAFQRYWREIHGPIAARIPSIRRYEQNHRAADAHAGGAEPRFNGLAVTWFDSTAAMREGAASPAYAQTRADEPSFLDTTTLAVIITREVPAR